MIKKEIKKNINNKIRTPIVTKYEQIDISNEIDRLKSFNHAVNS